MDEYKLYEKLKKSFTVVKGKILLMEVSSDNVLELKPEIIEKGEDCRGKVSFYVINGKRYASFDDLNKKNPIFVFRGKTFRKVEVLSTGEVLSFVTFSDKPPTAEEIQKDFERLALILGNPKGS